jgi:pimeloyl-ACP methyl ester carboxylesterase
MHGVRGSLVPIDRDILQAMRERRKDPLAALGEFLSAAESASRQLARNPRDTAARDAYNFAISRVLGTVKDAKLDPWRQPLRVPAAGGELLLTHKPDPRPLWNPALYDFTPADQFDIGGTYVAERVRKEGVGAPLVAVGRELNANAKSDFALPRTYYGVTAILRFEGRRCVLSFEDPLAKETIRLGTHTFPLAADFTVPIAVMLASTDTGKMGLPRLLRPAKYAETARTFRLQPYDPNKTVVLVIHGLMSSPSTWTPMINSLRGDAVIRRNFQFWFYSYPSGYAYPYSAAILRRELDRIQRSFPLRKPLVVIGHSMGGCISRLLITDAGDRLWMKFFTKPPEDVPLSAEAKELLVESLIFQHRREVGRVVFISAPLRGADMAKGLAGRIGSWLVKSPETFTNIGRDLLELTTFQAGDLKLRRIPNSVDTLAPNNRFVKAINTIPLTPGIPYHVICGDRGKGGNKDTTKPVMSDGLVPYWSSHLDGAQSELIVPSTHNAQQTPEAIAEVKRILRMHARR